MKELQVGFKAFFSPPFTPFEIQQPPGQMANSVFRSIHVSPDRFFRDSCADLIGKQLQFCAISPGAYIATQTSTIHSEDASVSSGRGLRSRPRLLVYCHVISRCTHSSHAQLGSPHLRKDIAGLEKGN